MSNSSEFKDSKADLRHRILKIRDHLSAKKHAEKSFQACKHAGDHIEFEPDTIISGFFPIRSEINPCSLMDQLRQGGARLCVPVVLDKITIIFRELAEDTKLVDVGFGTKGPSPTARILDPEILLMPLSVFDKKGGRIGYGAGHYDRRLCVCKKKKFLQFLSALLLIVSRCPMFPLKRTTSYWISSQRNLAFINCVEKHHDAAFVLG